MSAVHRYGPEALRRLQVIDVAKRAGFTLEEAAVLLATDGRGNPAHAQLRELAARKLPEVEALIARTEAMRDWLDTATGCNCETLDVCALFDDARLSAAAEAPKPVELEITHVGGGEGDEPL
jgi:MerR family transcriptional regulator, redox-sensitive transcriptional activator SoxR